MKSTFKTIGFLVAGAAILAVGYWTGFSSGLFKHMATDSIVPRSATEAAMLSLKIDQINDGKIEDLKILLNHELNTEIITLDTLINWKNPNERDLRAIKILRKIADQRSSADYHELNESALTETLNAIYEKAKTYPIKIKKKP